MNKEKAFSIMVLIVAFMMPLFVFAASDAGLKPTSIFYFLDITAESINLFFTFDLEKRAEKALAYAEERLAEIEVVGFENNPRAVEKVTEQYRKNIVIATSNARELQDEEKAKKLLATISDNTARHQETLIDIYKQVPEEVKGEIAKSLEVSVKGREAALQQIASFQNEELEQLKRRLTELEQQPASSEENSEVEVLQQEIKTLKQQKLPEPRVVEKIVEKLVSEESSGSSSSPALAPAPTASSPQLSNTDIVKKVKPAVVHIRSGDSSGSGMIIDAKGYILTNAHVVGYREIVEVKLHTGESLTANVTGKDISNDLAVLIINERTGGFPSVEFGSSASVVQGDKIFVLGYPFGLGGDVSFTEGVYSRSITHKGVTYMEISAILHPGNSGGPLVDSYGKVIAINTAVFGLTTGNNVIVGESLKWALPIDIIQSKLPTLKGTLKSQASAACQELQVAQAVYDDWYNGFLNSVYDTNAYITNETATYIWLKEREVSYYDALDTLSDLVRDHAYHQPISYLDPTIVAIRDDMQRVIVNLRSEIGYKLTGLQYITSQPNESARAFALFSEKQKIRYEILNNLKSNNHHIKTEYKKGLATAGCL